MATTTGFTTLVEMMGILCDLAYQAQLIRIVRTKQRGSVQFIESVEGSKMISYPVLGTTAVLSCSWKDQPAFSFKIVLFLDGHRVYCTAANCCSSKAGFTSVSRRDIQIWCEREWETRGVVT